MVATVVERIWRQQSSWSQTANRLRRDLDRSRTAVLGCGVVGAVLSGLSVVAGLGSPPGTVLAFASAAAIAIAGIIRSRTGEQAVQNWTRARSISEAIKSEVYTYLSGGNAPTDAATATGLDQRINEIEDDAGELLRFTADVTPVDRELPAVTDVGSYLNLRVGGQIDGFYRPKAAELRRKLSMFRRLELVVVGAGALAAAAAGVWKHDAIAVWVPVITTIAAALTAHVGASRYEYLLVEYLRTASKLERLRDRRGTAASLSDEQLVEECEDVISIQNEAWMVKLASPDPS